MDTKQLDAIIDKLNAMMAESGATSADFDGATLMTLYASICGVTDPNFPSGDEGAVLTKVLAVIEDAINRTSDDQAKKALGVATSLIGHMLVDRRQLIANNS